MMVEYVLDASDWPREGHDGKGRRSTLLSCVSRHALDIPKNAFTMPNQGGALRIGSLSRPNGGAG